MKPYQHHDEYHDIGKATPVAQAPRQDSLRPHKLLCNNPVGVPEYHMQYVYHKHPDVKGNRETRVIVTRNTPRAVTLKRQSRGPFSQRKARRL